MHYYFFTVVNNGSVIQKGESILLVSRIFFNLKLHILVLMNALVLRAFFLDCLEINIDQKAVQS